MVTIVHHFLPAVGCHSSSKFSHDLTIIDVVLAWDIETLKESGLGHDRRVKCWHLAFPQNIQRLP
jgi:hypothetical protein